MDEVRSEQQPSVADWSAGAGELAQKFLQQGQSVAHQMSEANSEVAEFVKMRLGRDVETMRAMAACKGLPEIIDLQVTWFRTAVNDYMAEINKLVELNSRILSSYAKSTDSLVNLRPIERTGTRS